MKNTETSKNVNKLHKKGLNNNQIARKLGVTPATISYHVKRSNLVPNIIDRKQQLKKHLSKLVAVKDKYCKNNNLPFNLDTNYLLELYNKQKGKCYYSTNKMQIFNSQYKIDDALSIDRVVTENGYIKGNIVLCTQKYNRIKNNMSLLEFKEYSPSNFIKLYNDPMLYTKLYI